VVFIYRLICPMLFLVMRFQFLQAQEVRPERAQISVKLDNSQVQVLYSTFLKDSIHLYVGLPSAYHENMDQYPVLYLADGDDFVLMAAEMSRLMAVDKEIPPMIIVGLAYGAHITKPGNHRNRDYSPYFETGFPESGGASLFMDALQSEVFSSVNSTYRTMPAERYFFGTSLGGLLGTYILFHRPEMFSRYILSSPSLWWGHQGIFQEEASYFQSRKSLAARAYFSVGSEEDQAFMKDPILRLIQKLDTRKYEGFQYQFEVLPGETHLSAGPSSLVKGLRYISGKNPQH